MIKKEIRISKRNREYIVYTYSCDNCKCQIARKPGLCKKCYINSIRSENKIFDGKKECSSCKQILLLKNFHITTTKKYNSRCTRCHNFKRFNKTALDYKKLYDIQEGKCYICNKSETEISRKTNKPLSLSFDHCHKTGITRGLLCTKCNKGLGLFNDNIDLLQKAIEYLLKYKYIK